MKISKIINLLEDFFPLNKGIKNDNIGQNFYFDDLEVEKIAIGLDLTLELAEYARDNDIKLLILHHPILFYKYEEEIKNSIKKKIINIIEKNKICCYVIHTNYNNSSIGINAKILELLEISNVKLLSGNDVTYYGKNNLDKTYLTIINKIKKILNLNYVQYIGTLDKLIQKIAICSGSGNYSTKNLENNNIDLFITGELKWSECVDLEQKGINVLLLGHYMEDFFVNDIKKIIEKNLSDSDIKIFEYNKKNIIKIYT